MNIYPEQLRQILAYVKALDSVEPEIIDNRTVDHHDMDVILRIKVYDSMGMDLLGELIDEIGGAWSFKAAP